MPQAKKPAEGDTTTNAIGDFVVTAAGANVSQVEGAPPRLVLQGRVVSLPEEEAHRLLLQGAIRAATDEDHVREALVAAREEADRQVVADAGPAGNPYGGSLRGVESLEAHAAEEIAKAKKDAK